jgi:hypothetical protein
MKQAFVVLSLLTLAACTSPTADAPFSGESIAYEVLSLSPQAIPTVYSLLSAEEKRSVWLSHLDQIEARSSWNEKQRALVRGLRTHIQSEYWKVRDHSDSFETSWRANAQRVFTDREIHDLAYSLGSRRPASLLNMSEENPPKDCSCSMSARHTCGRLVSWDTVEYGECDNDLHVDCTITDSGCGFLFAASCDGSICRY